MPSFIVPVNKRVRELFSGGTARRQVWLKKNEQHWNVSTVNEEARLEEKGEERKSQEHGNIAKPRHVEPHDPDSEQGDDPSTKKSAMTQTATLFRRNLRKTIRRRAGAVGGLQKESNAHSGRLVSRKLNHVVDPQAEPDLLEAGKDDCQTPKTVGPSLCPTGTQLYQPNRKGTRNKEDRPCDFQCAWRPVLNNILSGT